MINIYRNCPFCTFQFNDKLVPIYRSYYQKIISSYVKCNQCKIVYVDPIPNQSILKEIYDENTVRNLTGNEEDSKVFDRAIPCGFAVSNDFRVDFRCNISLAFLEISIPCVFTMSSTFL